MMFSLGAIALCAITRSFAAQVAMWSAIGLSLFAYIAAVGPTNVSPALESWIVSALVVTVCLSSWVRPTAMTLDSRKLSSGAAGFIVGLLGMRLAYVVASMPHSGSNAMLAAILVGLGYSVGAAAFSLLRKSEAGSAVGWGMFVIAGCLYVTASIGISGDMAVMSALLVAYVAGSVAMTQFAGRHRHLWHVVALLGWVVFTQWVNVALIWNGAHLHGFSGVTVAWIVYALAILTLGFWLKLKEFRYWGLGVMFTTVSKILLVDLQNTSVPFRVGVLLGLGLLMLGSGYLYIRGRGAPRVPAN
jgi:hypothetical protein